MALILTLFCASVAASVQPELRSALIAPRSNLPHDITPVNRHVLARQSILYCNPYQYCINSYCCISTNLLYLSCMPSGGDCCPNGQFCPPGYACSFSGIYTVCECKGSTCSQDQIDAEDSPVATTASEEDDYRYQDTTTTSSEYDYTTSSDYDYTTSDYDYTSTYSTYSTYSTSRSTGVAEAQATGTDARRPAAAEETYRPDRGLTRSDKIALGCGIGIALPATLTGLVMCFIAVRKCMSG